MNERIRELAEQAGLLPKEIGPVVETRHMKNKQHDLEKFAELIVRECMEQVITGPNGPAHYAVEAALRLKKHFGVES